MALILKRLYQGYFWVFEDLADPRSNDYPLTSPLSVLVILFFYHNAIHNWGPKLMKHRAPYNLKQIMIWFNVIQILTNLYLVYMGTIEIFEGNISWRCAEVDYTEDGRKMLNLTFLYYILKVSDLLDTIFFILRKKYNQITFLHVYHHMGMVFGTWMATKFFGGGHTFYIGYPNAIVHSVMYSYYLLTAIDSEFRKVVWLKKFVTQIQLVQFAFMLYSFGKLGFYPDCNYPKAIVYLIIPQNILMIIMFTDFYIKAYREKPRNVTKEAATRKVKCQ